MRLMTILPAMLLANAAYGWEFVDVTLPQDQIRPTAFQRQFDIFGGQGQRLGQILERQAIVSGSVVLSRQQTGAEAQSSITYGFLPQYVRTTDQWAFGRRDARSVGTGRDRYDTNEVFVYDTQGWLRSVEFTGRWQGGQSRTSTRILRDAQMRRQREVTLNERGTIIFERAYVYDEEQGTARVEDTEFQPNGVTRKSYTIYLYDKNTDQIIYDVVVSSESYNQDQSKTQIQGQCQQAQGVLTCEKEIYSIPATGGSAQLQENRMEYYTLVRTTIAANPGTTLTVVSAAPTLIESYEDNTLVSRENFTYTPLFKLTLRTQSNGKEVVERAETFYDERGRYIGEEIYGWNEQQSRLELVRRVALRN